MNILVTGASGFVGHSATLELSKRDFVVHAFTRAYHDWPSRIIPFNSPSISDLKYHHPAFKGVECVLHLAGRAHVMRERKANSIQEFIAVNCMETLEIARQASLAGVRRFVFVSSVKVNGESSTSLSPKEILIP